jgi:hypothetical protein
MQGTYFCTRDENGEAVSRIMKKTLIFLLLILFPLNAHAVKVVSLDGNGITVSTFAPPLLVTPSSTGGTLAAGTYYYSFTMITAVGTTVLGAESSTSTVGATGKVTMTFQFDADAVTYRVWRSTTPGVYTGYIADISGASTSFVDTGLSLTAATPPSVPTTAPPAPIRESVGTVDQVIVTQSPTTIVFSLPQSISPTSNVVFGNVTISNVVFKVEAGTNLNTLKLLLCTGTIPVCSLIADNLGAGGGS